MFFRVLVGAVIGAWLFVASSSAAPEDDHQLLIELASRELMRCQDELAKLRQYVEAADQSGDSGLKAMAGRAVALGEANCDKLKRVIEKVGQTDARSPPRDRPAPQQPAAAFSPEERHGASSPHATIAQQGAAPAVSQPPRDRPAPQQPAAASPPEERHGASPPPTIAQQPQGAIAAASQPPRDRPAPPQPAAASSPEERHDASPHATVAQQPQGAIAAASQPLGDHPAPQQPAAASPPEERQGASPRSIAQEPQLAPAASQPPEHSTKTAGRDAAEPKPPLATAEPSGPSLLIHFPATSEPAAADARALVERLGSGFERTETLAVAKVPSHALVRYSISADRSAARKVGRMLGSMGYTWHLEKYNGQPADSSLRTVDVWLPEQ